MIRALAVLPFAINAAPTGNDYESTPSPPPAASSTCGDIKDAFKEADCCGAPSKDSGFQVVPIGTMISGENVCAKKKVPLNNTDCLVDDIVAVLEQSGTNVTKGYVGGMNVGSREPITTSYLEAGLCPVNVHWHLGAEHLSVGEFDEEGQGPPGVAIGGMSRRLGESVRLGNRCHYYDETDEKFTTPYAWKHCVGMEVGETYEVHWPHSASGACGTPNQYQTPFYDGVFCMGLGPLGITGTNLTAEVQGHDGSAELSQKVAVQGQIFTIVNDESYYYPDLMRGMIVDGDFGDDMAKYTGSTTGTSRSNTVCSQYAPITWQVDRKCHLISASTFDKMCADMKTQRDDMSHDLYAHGSRETVATELAANNHQERL